MSTGLINGRYRLLKKLGEGGMGSVYLVQDESTDRPVALKTFGGASTHPDHVEYFKHEFRTLARLRHPNLQEVYDFGLVRTSAGVVSEGALYFTSEYVDGQDLMAATRETSQDRLLELVAQVCRALQYVHSHGLIHYDVKPENILVRGDRTAKLMDFGLASEERGERGVKIRGTVHYIAPEVIKGDPIDRRADLYSLGVTLFAVLSRQLPFVGESTSSVLRQHVERVPELPTAVLAHLDAPLVRLVLRLLEKDPADRFHSANEVIEAINRFSGRTHEVQTTEDRRSRVTGGRFVGRRRELAALKEALAGVVDHPRESPARMVVVAGETGIGKTRLIREFRYHAQLAGAHFLAGSAYEGEARTYGPWAQVVTEAARVSGADRVGRYRDALGRIARGLAPAEGLPESGLRAEDERVRLMDRLAAFLVELAVENPTVVCLQDVHWADEATLDLAGYLARNAGSAPLLICSSCRTEGRALERLKGRVGAGPHLKVVELGALAEDDLATLVESMLGEAAPPGFIRKLAQETTGNPLFVEEAMKGIVEDEAAWRAGGGALDLAQVEVPRSVAEVVSRRVRDFTGSTRALLDVLSTFHRPVPLWVLRRLSGLADEELFDILREMDLRQILRREGGAESGYDYAFVHRAMQDVLYRSIPDARRRELHRLIGNLLAEDRVHGESDHVEELAFHHVSAVGADSSTADRLVAAYYATAAATRARGLHAHDQAIRFLEFALALIPEGDQDGLVETLAALGESLEFVGRLDDARRRYLEAAQRSRETRAAELHRRLGVVAHKQGELQEALGHLRHALEFLPPGQEARQWARVFASMADVHIKTGSYRLAARFAEQGHALLRESEDSEEAVETLNALAKARYYTGDVEAALGHWRECLAIQDRRGDRAGYAAMLNNIGAVQSTLSRVEEALDYHLRAMRIREEVGDVVGMAASCNNIGICYIEMGDHAAAMRYQEKGRSVREKIGDTQGLSLSLLNLGQLHAARGASDTALDHYTRALSIQRRIGDRRGTAVSLNYIGGLHMMKASYGPALEKMTEALGVLESIDDVREQVLVRLHLADLHVRLGDRVTAEAHMERARAVQEKVGTRGGVADLQLHAGWFALTAGRWQEADSMLRQSRSVAEELGSRNGLVMANLYLGYLAALRGDRVGAVESIEAARRRTGDVPQPEFRILAPLALGLASPPDDVRGHLEDALTQARVLDAPEWVWRCQQALGRAFQAAGDRSAAGAHFKEAVLVIKQVWGRVPEAFRDSYLKDPARQEVHQDILRLMRETGRHSAPPLVPAPEGEAPPQEEEALPATEAALLRMLARVVESGLDTPRLFNLITSILVEAAGAERGFLLRVGPQGELVFEAARNKDSEEIPSPQRKVSTSLVERAVATGEVVRVEDATGDERFRRSRSVAYMGLRSVLVVPIAYEGKVHGVIYLDNRFARSNFEERQERLVWTFAQRIGAFFANALEHAETTRRLEDLTRAYKEAARELSDRYSYGRIIGRSLRMREVFRLLEKVAGSDHPALITGESGTGKEMVAKAIHYNGPRRDGPFVPENCGALAESILESELFGYTRGAFTGADRDRKGLIELAHGGTLFLDEIAETSPSLQKKLLRVLQEGELRPLGANEVRKVDVRVVSATNRDLRAAMAAGTFLPDLYYRLCVLHIELPPLRARVDDIPLLVETFLEGSARRLDREAMALLCRHRWPGNVRELGNVLDRARLLTDGEVIGADCIVLDDLEAAHAPRRGGPARGPAATPSAVEGISERQARLLAELTPDEVIASSEYSHRVGTSRRTGIRDLNQMVERGLLERVGGGKSSRYRRASGRLTEAGVHP
ncbi:MAG: sigma 54-interacting transcriptional regulator [Planctomycetes bacterium]|nr:sigma 54-interacting transcriptional regulator [Planctomycetota bacterium]